MAYPLWPDLAVGGLIMAKAPLEVTVAPMGASRRCSSTFSLSQQQQPRQQLCAAAGSSPSTPTAQGPSLLPCLIACSSLMAGVCAPQQRGGLRRMARHHRPPGALQVRGAVGAAARTWCWRGPAPSRAAPSRAQQDHQQQHMHRALPCTQQQVLPPCFPARTTTLHPHTHTHV